MLTDDQQYSLVERIAILELRAMRLLGQSRDLRSQPTGDW